jgi:hypothetical protein
VSTSFIISSHTSSEPICFPTPSTILTSSADIEPEES